MKLTSKQKKYLKGEAHHLPVLVQVGKNGCSELLINQLAASLADHELVKVRVTAEDQAEFKTLVDQIADKVEGILIHTIGHTAIFFKQNVKETRFALPAG